MADAMVLHAKTIPVNHSLRKRLDKKEKCKVCGLNNIKINSNLTKETVVMTVTLILLRRAIIAKTQCSNECICALVHMSLSQVK